MVGELSLLPFHSMATHADALLLLLLQDQDQMAPINVVGGGGGGGGGMLVRPNLNNKRPKTSTVNDATTGPTSVVPTLPNSFGGCCSSKEEKKKKKKKKKAVLDSTAKLIITDRKFSSSTSSNICNLQGMCFMCKKGDQLLICTTQGCPIQIHASCLGCLPTIDDDDTGKFYCPPCSYNRATTELQEAEKEVALAVEKALSAKQSLSLFVNHYGTNHDNNKHERGRMKSKDSTGVAGNPQKTTISTACTNGGDSGKEKSPARKKMNDTLLTRKGGDHTKQQVGRHQNESMEDKLDQAVAGTSGGGDFGVEAALISETNDATVNAKQAGIRNDTGMIEEHQHTRKVGQPGMHAEAEIGCGTSSPPCIATETLAAHVNGNNQDAVLKPKMEKNITSSSSKDNSSPKHFTNPTRPNLRCNSVPWTSAEEEMIKKGVKKLSGQINKNIPWKKILASGSHVFKECRTALHLREKWRRMNRVNEQSSDGSDD